MNLKAVTVFQERPLDEVDAGAEECSKEASELTGRPNTPNADVSQREVLTKQRGSVDPAYHLVFSSGVFSRGRRRVAR